MNNTTILSKYSPFYLITIAIAILLVAPFLLQDGMFMDGQQYACVAKNMANGKGSFWHPIASNTWIMAGTVDFIEHPPLFYWLESLSFRVFGNSMYSERFFCLLILLLNGLVIHRIWALVAQNKQLSWLPILLWISVPVCFWSFQNNIIETLLSLFTLLSVYFSLLLILTKQKTLSFLLLSSAFIFCAFLTKGLPGLFPLIIFLLYYLIFKKITLKQMLSYTAFCLFILILCSSLLVLNNDAHRYFYIYFNERFFQRVSNTSNVNNRFATIFNLLSELLIPIISSALLFIWSRKKYAVTEKNDRRFFYFFLLLGLSASLPIMATMVQKNFYFLAAIPHFAISFSLINEGFITHKIELLQTSTTRKLKVVAYLLLALSLFTTILLIGETSRDKEKLKNVSLIGKYLKNEKYISTNEDVFFDWGLKFYLIRKFDIELDVINQNRLYFITKEPMADSLLSNYTTIDLGLTDYRLYKKR